MRRPCHRRVGARVRTELTDRRRRGMALGRRCVAAAALPRDGTPATRRAILSNAAPSLQERQRRRCEDSTSSLGHKGSGSHRQPVTCCSMLCSMLLHAAACCSMLIFEGRGRDTHIDRLIASTISWHGVPQTSVTALESVDCNSRTFSAGPIMPACVARGIEEWRGRQKEANVAGGTG